MVAKVCTCPCVCGARKTDMDSSDNESAPDENKAKKKVFKWKPPTTNSAEEANKSNNPFAREYSRYTYIRKKSKTTWTEYWEKMRRITARLNNPTGEDKRLAARHGDNWCFKKNDHVQAEVEKEMAQERAARGGAPLGDPNDPKEAMYCVVPKYPHLLSKRKPNPRKI